MAGLVRSGVWGLRVFVLLLILVLVLFLLMMITMRELVESGSMRGMIDVSVNRVPGSRLSQHVFLVCLSICCCCGEDD